MPTIGGAANAYIATASITSAQSTQGGISVTGAWTLDGG